MNKAESAQEFYDNWLPSANVKGNFNVFEVKTYLKRPLPYNRRDFYKISLLIGSSKLLYADKGIVIDRPALIFSSYFNNFFKKHTGDTPRSYRQTVVL